MHKKHIIFKHAFCDFPLHKAQKLSVAVLQQVFITSFFY